MQSASVWVWDLVVKWVEQLDKMMAQCKVAPMVEKLVYSWVTMEQRSELKKEQ